MHFGHRGRQSHSLICDPEQTLLSSTMLTFQHPTIWHLAHAEALYLLLSLAMRPSISHTQASGVLTLFKSQHYCQNSMTDGL